MPAVASAGGRLAWLTHMAMRCIGRPAYVSELRQQAGSRSSAARTVAPRVSGEGIPATHPFLATGLVLAQRSGRDRPVNKGVSCPSRCNACLSNA